MDSFLELLKNGQINTNWFLTDICIHCTYLDWSSKNLDRKLRKNPKGEPVLDLEYSYIELSSEAQTLKKQFYNLAMAMNSVMDSLFSKFHNKDFQKLLQPFKGNSNPAQICRRS